MRGTSGAKVGLALGSLFCGAVSCRGCTCTDEMPEVSTSAEPGDAAAASAPLGSPGETSATSLTGDPQPEAHAAAPTSTSVVTAPGRVEEATPPTPVAAVVVPPVTADEGHGAEETPGEDAANAVSVTFSWHQPPDGAVTLFPDLLLRGDAPAGTRVKIEGGRSVNVSGAFAIPLKLKREGRQQIALSVTTPAGRERHTRTVTFIDVGRVDRFQAAVSGQRVAVEELERLRSDLLETITAVRGVLPTVSSSTRAELQGVLDDLQTELDALGVARADLAGDIDAELDGVEQLRQASGLSSRPASP